MNKKSKIVIDTNVILSAFRSVNGASNRLMQMIGTGKFISCISVGLILEYEDVLTREIHQLNKTQIKRFLDYICLVSEHVKVHFSWRPTLKDPSDDMLLELAISANASYIITYNISDFKEANKFNVEIITPKDYLKILGEIS
jgi:putative PIN family toxin of toxin-antitoxin system